MKKRPERTIGLVLALLTVLMMFTACGGSSEEKSEETPAANASGKTLVVYFSRTGEQYNVGKIKEGNTAIVAKMIAEKTGADAVEIVSDDDHYPYTYDELTDVAKKEQEEDARPGYKADVPDLESYDTVFFGAPVWWGDWPMIMYTFFEKNQKALDGKTLVPFCTHEGSGLSGFDESLAEIFPKSSIGTGFDTTGQKAQNSRDDVKKEVNEWLEELGY